MQIRHTALAIGLIAVGLTSLPGGNAEASFFPWPWDARSTPVPPPYGWVHQVPPPGYTETARFEHDPRYPSDLRPYSWLSTIYPELREDDTDANTATP